MSLAGKSLSILSPMYGGNLKCNFFESFIRMQMALMQYRVPFAHSFVYKESLVPRARNRLADIFLKEHDTTHALLVDADIGFDPAQVLAMLEHDRDILAAPCSKQSIKWERIQKAVKKNGRDFTHDQLERLAGDFVFNFEAGQVPAQFDVRELQRMRNMGTGLMMVRRNVFETFREKYVDRWYEARDDAAALPGPVWDFFRAGINPETRLYDSEDYWFCMDCRAIGFTVEMAPWVVTTHMGTHNFIADMPAVAALVGGF